MDDTQNTLNTTKDTAFVTYDEEPAQQSSTTDPLAMLDLEKTIKIYHQSIIAKQNELRKFKEMIKDTLENDQVYEEHEAILTEAKNKLKATKDQLMNIGSVISTLEEMKELSSEMKDLKKHLSEQLMKYYDLTNAQSITMDDGETYMIQAQAKLVKQSSAYKP